MEPKRMSAEEKDALLKEFHPDYRPEGFAEIKIGPNKGEKAPVELCNLLMSNSRLLGENIDLNKVDYDVDVLVIGGGGAGCFCGYRGIGGRRKGYDCDKAQNRRRKHHDG